MSASLVNDIESIVCDDIKRRQAVGIAKYGQTVAQSNLSLRDWLQHAYEESLDKSIYLRRAIAELDRDAGGNPTHLPEGNI